MRVLSLTLALFLGLASSKVPGQMHQSIMNAELGVTSGEGFETVPFDKLPISLFAQKNKLFRAQQNEQDLPEPSG